jgi:hypothetical protein
MELTLAFDPPSLVHWWRLERRRYAPVALDVVADRVEGDVWRFGLDVSFQGADLLDKRQRHMVGALAYTHARVSIDGEYAEVRGKSAPMVFEADVKLSGTDKQTVALTLKPKVKAGPVEFEPGELKYEPGHERAHETSFKYPVKLEHDVQRGSLVQWRLQLIPTPGVGLSFLEGNVYLFVDYDWRHKRPRGQIDVIPGEAVLFSASGAQLGALEQRWLRYRYAEEYKRVCRYDCPVRTVFEAVDS